VAEWALALMLIGLRNAGAQVRRLIEGDEFRRSYEDPGYKFGELTGRSVGLIGLGHIGRRLVELLTPRTRRMIGAAELNLLKPDAVFVNVSRGAIVDPDALIERAQRFFDGREILFDITSTTLANRRGLVTSGA
jgi:phosphoglycerate dehydrogenase-like enzyme